MRLKHPKIVLILLIIVSTVLLAGCGDGGLALPQQVEAAYTIKMQPVLNDLAESINNYYKARNDYNGNDIDQEEFRNETRKFVEGINSCYDDFQEIEAPRRLRGYHIAFSEAVGNYHKAALHFQDSIETDDWKEVFDHEVDAFAEMTNAKYALDRAEEEYQKYLDQ